MTRYRFMAWRKLFLGLSGTLLLVTVISLALQGLNFGIDFKGGVLMDITTPQVTTASAVSAVMLANYRALQPQVQALGSSGRDYQIQMLFTGGASGATTSTSGTTASSSSGNSSASSSTPASSTSKAGASSSTASSSSSKAAASTSTASSATSKSSASSSASGASSSTTGASTPASRTSDASNSESLAVLSTLQQHFGQGTVQTENTAVSPTIGRQLARRALLAVILATVLMTGYLGIRFQLGQGGAYSGLKFALAAVIALLHDITLTVGLFSIFRLPVNSPFVAAVLTVYGYSMNDTIIVFDRIRERLGQKRKEPLQDCIDVSVNQVLSRTIRTVTTVILALLAVYILGGQSTRHLALALLVGVSFGTYSSVFIASPVFLWLVGDRGLQVRPATVRAARTS